MDTSWSNKAFGFKVILASRDSKKGQEATLKLNESDLDVTFVVMDVHDQESIRLTITVGERFGRLDVLINNAGVYMDGNEKLLTMDPPILQSTMATNFFGVYPVIHSFIPLTILWKNH